MLYERVRPLLLGTLLLLAATLGSAAAPDLSGYKLIFEDDFSGDHLRYR